MSKIHPRGIVPHAEGPTYTKNDPIGFPNKGKKTGKTGANGVVAEASGPIFHENSTHIPTMDADKPADKKDLKMNVAKVNLADHKSSTELTFSQRGSGEPTDHEYFLKRNYDKSGQKMKIPNKALE